MSIDKIGTIQKANYNEHTGIIKEIKKQDICIGLGNGISGTETNVYATVVDENGKEHFGFLM